MTPRGSPACVTAAFKTPCARGSRTALTIKQCRRGRGEQIFSKGCSVGLLTALISPFAAHFITIGTSSFAMTLDAYRNTFRFAARYWLLSPRLFSLMIVARIASNLVDIFVPLASGALVDTLASSGGDLTAALRALARLIGLVVAFHALRTIVAWALIYVSSRAMEALVRDAFARVQRFSSDWHANSFACATVRKIARHVVVRSAKRYAAFW